MANYDTMPRFELIYVIVNYGLGSKVLHKAKEYGISGGTICLAKGTVNNSLMNFLSLYDERKEIVLMGSDPYTAKAVLTQLDKIFHFEKPNHGIVFTTGVGKIIGSSCYKYEEIENERGVDKSMYQVIISVVNRGKAEDVIEAAKAMGSKGGTIINGRGSGIHETMKFFNMEIEPEKEIVMILSKEEVAKDIIAAIREKLEIDKPGNGIIFVQDVNQVYGIYE